MSPCTTYHSWVLTTSSREVYDDPARTPVVESDPVALINVYRRSKAACEKVTVGGRDKGLGRLASVYGSVRDHPDRVMPAFCRAAPSGAPMHVKGVGYTFDFTHVLDVARGIERLVRLLETGRGDLPPIHIASGRATRLGDLARMANVASGGRSRIDQATNHAYNVSRFVGDPKRAGEILG